jgi:glycosyltransferase involved in cell wall biosynthesis
MQVAGYFKGVMGTGEHARQLAGALRTQGIQVSMTTLDSGGSPEDDELAREAAGGERTDAPQSSFAEFNLLCANADMVPSVAATLGEEFFAGRYTIGYWAWEVSAFPEGFVPAFDHVDEVWVGTRHVRDAVAPLAPVPVVAIPQPVSLPPRADRTEPPAGLPGGFRFLFAFDYLSIFERKNPLAAINAFARAFPPGSGAALVVKSLNHDHNPEAHERLRAAVASHPDVYLIEERLSRSERDGLMSAADCYVSLHRAEGFGYTLAESMWLGKPVIATGYSGNVDFMTPENSYLVDHQMVPIGAGNDPYPAEGLWAEPDVDHAAALMREVFEAPEEAGRRGERAAVEIRASHGPEAAGRAMLRRLEVVKSGELVGAGPAPRGRVRFGVPQRAARKALRRLLKR